MGQIMQEYKMFLIIWVIFIATAISLMYYLLIYQATNQAIADYKTNLIKINQ